MSRKEHFSLNSKALQTMASARGDASKKLTNPLSYPKSEEPFSKKLFKNPTSEYRGCPFWAWNNKLQKEQLLRQIDNFADMGMGGFHMHVRTGLDTEYMGPEFMDIVRSCVEYAESKKMLACLYDEDRWPSGSAGGRVIEHNPKFKAKHVVFTPNRHGVAGVDGDHASSSASACYIENNLLATYDVILDENGCLKSSRMLKEGESGGNLWYAYVETNGPDAWFNGQTYVDTLSEDAMAYFIKITHEVYKDEVGDKFGSVVPCIFTDEPQFAIKNQLASPWARNDVFLPWTTDLAKTFKQIYSADLVGHLPEVVWNLPEGKPSVTRYRYHDHVCERFVSAHMDQIGNWCRENNLILNGHMMEEDTLHTQTTAIGEAMRCYRNMGMPGIDLLVDRVEYNTAKQASSVARQSGIRGTMSELYGVTHWYFTFEGHKGCGDWQAALGITFRVHHLTWVSMAGEGKRDYPACIGYQSPWYKEYGYIEDHFARVGVAMTRGKAVTRVAVIHPIESYWLQFGPNQSGDEMWLRDQVFGELTNWLLHGLVDFDFISESLLPGQASNKGPKKKLTVGKCEYDVVILPNLVTIRSSTLKILRNFSKSGGAVIIAGSAPNFVDAEVPHTKPIIEGSKSVFWSEQCILNALEGYRELRISIDNGVSTEKLLYQMRQDGDTRFVFICNTDRNSPVETTVYLKGAWNVEIMDTFTGEEAPLDSYACGEWTTFPYRFEGCASLLLRMAPLSGAASQPPSSANILDNISSRLTTNSEIALDSISLSEPNVLMLDYAQYELDSEPWSSVTEVLRIENQIRGRLNLPLKGSRWKQPYTIPVSERVSKANVKLRFTFGSAFTISEPTQLALEPIEGMQIHLNGIPLVGSSGWWVDEAISTTLISGKSIKSGINFLELSFPFGILTNIERVYLLGSSFKVSLRGARPLLQPLDLKLLTWGDIVPQGLPFYAGNVIYNCSLSVKSTYESSKVTLLVPNFSSPVLTVTNTATKEKIGRIAIQPHSLELGTGVEKVIITAFGNRYNSFGHIHAANGVGVGYCDPDSWRSGGDGWTDEYMVRPIGVLECPTITIETGKHSVEQTERTDADWVIVSRNLL